MEKHYAENRLPTYTSHVMVNEMTVEGSNAGPKQLKIGIKNKQNICLEKCISKLLLLRLHNGMEVGSFTILRFRGAV